MRTKKRSVRGVQALRSLWAARPSRRPFVEEELCDKIAVRYAANTRRRVDTRAAPEIVGRASPCSAAEDGARTAQPLSPAPQIGLFDVTRAELNTVSSECFEYCGVETPGSGESYEACHGSERVSLYLSKRVVTCDTTPAHRVRSRGTYIHWSYCVLYR